MASLARQATSQATRLGAQARLLAPAQGVPQLLQASRNMNSRTSGMMEPLEKPWPYEKLGYGYYWSLLDGTTKRFKDNSKMIVVEGPPALKKTQFAKELAEEFGMKFVPGFTMEDFYVNPYGYDLRELDFVMSYVRNKSYDERKFAQDPTGQQGGLDRMLWTLHMWRFKQYMGCLEHLFNTGQGIVTERSPHSDWVYMEAAYSQGWISRSTRTHYYKIRKVMADTIQRPNLIIYLDAPTDVVQANIRARAAVSHPWEQNSPVYENTDYLEHLYGDLFKKQYLREAGQHSYVLSYDWSEGGDTEVVVEDIDRMEMDYHDKYDKQQLDWRLLSEDGFGQKRANYTGFMKDKILTGFCSPFWSADDLLLSSPEATERDRVYSRLPGNFYMFGHNTDLGDSDPFFRIFTGSTMREQTYKEVGYQVESMVIDDLEIQHGDLVRAAAKEQGEADWWKQGWPAHAAHH